MEDDLLQLDATKRATCDAIVKKISAILKQCLRSHEYCTQRTRKDLSRAPTDLSHKTSVSFSDEMRKEYLLNIDPNAQILPTNPFPPRSNSAADHNGRSAPNGYADVVSQRRTTRANSYVPPPHEHTGREFVATMSMDRDPLLLGTEGRNDLTPWQVRERLPKIYRRIRSSMKERFKPHSSR